MTDLFKEILPSILQTKKNPFENDDYSDYTPFIVNRALSQHFDTILYANEMNIYNNLDKKMQYDFLINTIRPMRRKFSPWAKKEKIDSLDSVKKYFGYSNQKAKEILRILNDDQLEKIKEKIDIGGKNGRT